MINLLLLAIFVLFFVSTGEARCLEMSKESFYKSVPYFVKGSVKNLKVKKNSDSEDITFSINVLAPFKGDLSEQELVVNYKWTDSKEPVRKFREGATYVFAINTIKDGRATIETSSCSPQLTEQELASLRNGTPFKSAHDDK
jgi:hypothetical protein